MARKLYYMVRHGESVLNAEHVRQGAEGGLSEKGREQAAATGRRLANTKFDVMLVSPYERTRETAGIIAKYVEVGKGGELLDLLVERRNPSEIVGKSADEREVRYIVDLIDRSYHSDDYRYSDEENFTDLKDRARRLLAYLQGRPEEKLLIVTHSIFLKMIAAYVIHGEKLDAKKYNVLSFTNDSNNASVTVFEYQYRDSWFRESFIGKYFLPPEHRWSLVAWDDYTR